MPDFTDKEFERLLASGELPEITRPREEFEPSPEFRSPDRPVPHEVPRGEPRVDSLESSNDVASKLTDINTSLRDIDTKMTQLLALLSRVMEE